MQHQKIDRPFARAGLTETGLYWLELLLPGVPKTPNEIYSSNRFVRHKNAVNWKQIVYLTARGYEPQEPLTLVHLSLIRYAPRTLDYDGLVGSMKPIVDGLITRRDKKQGLKKDEREILWPGIIDNDTWAITGPWFVDQMPAPVGQEYVRVIVRQRAADQLDRKP